MGRIIYSLMRSCSSGLCIRYHLALRKYLLAIHPANPRASKWAKTRVLCRVSRLTASLHSIFLIQTTMICTRKSWWSEMPPNSINSTTHTFLVDDSACRMCASNIVVRKNDERFWFSVERGNYSEVRARCQFFGGDLVRSTVIFRHR